MKGNQRQSQLKPSLNVKPLGRQDQTYTISMLENAYLYFLHYVLIVIQDNGCRLVVIQGDRVFFDKSFISPLAAKYAFTKLFKEIAFCDELKNQWSHFYHPDPDWLNKLIDLPRGRLEDILPPPPPEEEAEQAS